MATFPIDVPTYLVTARVSPESFEAVRVRGLVNERTGGWYE